MVVPNDTCKFIVVFNGGKVWIATHCTLPRPTFPTTPLMQQPTLILPLLLLVRVTNQQLLPQRSHAPLPLTPPFLHLPAHLLVSLAPTNDNTVITLLAVKPSPHSR
jgi:hypothetical protein